MIVGKVQIQFRTRLTPLEPWEEWYPLPKTLEFLNLESPIIEFRSVRIPRRFDILVMAVIARIIGPRGGMSIRELYQGAMETTGLTAVAGPRKKGE